MWRQGDIFFEQVKEVPELASQAKIEHGIIAHGEVTGHQHRIEDLSTAALFFNYNKAGEFFLKVTAPQARIVHEEHGPIHLPIGSYRVWRQREYSPEAIRYVYD